jgi:hypothetical protein
MSNIVNRIGTIGKALGLVSVMLSLAFAFIAAPSASAAGLSGSGLPASTTDGKLVVNVSNALNGVPLAGASVAVFDDQGNLVARATTPVTGQISFLLSAGDYKVAAKAVGFGTTREAVRVSAGLTTNVKEPLFPTLPIPVPSGK